MKGGRFKFPIADGTLSGGDQDLRTYTLIRDSPDRREEQGNLLGESDGFSSNPHQDSSWYDGEAGHDFRSTSGDFVHRHHVEPRVKLYRPKRRIISYSTETNRRYQDYRYILGCNVGENVDDYWSVDGGRELSDTWTSFTRFTIISEKPRDGYTWSGKRLTRKQTTSRPDTLWPEMWKHMSDASKRKEKQKWAIERPKLENARRLRGIYFIDPDDEDFKDIMKNARRKSDIPMPAATP